MPPRRVDMPWLVGVGVSVAAHGALFLSATTPPRCVSTSAANSLVEAANLSVETEVDTLPIAEAPAAASQAVVDRRQTPERSASLNGVAAATRSAAEAPAAPPSRAAGPARAQERPAASSGEPSPLVVSEKATPRFTIALSSGSLASAGPAGSPGTYARAADLADDSDGAFAEQAVDVPARLTRGEPPSYPIEARDDGLEADVPLELLVSTTGGVERARALRSFADGLADAAVAAARRFRFAPAIKGGRPVRVRVRWTMQFRLR